MVFCWMSTTNTITKQCTNLYKKNLNDFPIHDLNSLAKLTKDDKI